MKTAPDNHKYETASDSQPLPALSKGDVTKKVMERLGGDLKEVRYGPKAGEIVFNTQKETPGDTITQTWSIEIKER